MTTRLGAGSDEGVRSGYDAEGIPDNFSIPACTVEDVDRALFRLFDSEIGFQLTTERFGTQDVPVIFATGERFALVKRKKPIRDDNNVLILPLISIRRTGIQQASEDMVGRGINQHTGDLIIKRRLSADDRQYQKLINKLDITNQEDVAIEDDDSIAGTRKVRTKRSTGLNKKDLDISDGALLAPKAMSDNIYEFITIPQPQFYTAMYEIVFFTEYTQHANLLINRLMEMYLPQGKQFKLETDKGYWFVAQFGDSFSADDNFSDFSEQERVIMSTITCEVKAYLIPGGNDGDEAPVRRFVSAPSISFCISDNSKFSFVDDPYRNADDPTDNFLLTELDDPERRGKPSDKRLKYHTYIETVKNPLTGKNDKRYVRVITLDTVGETVLREL